MSIAAINWAWKQPARGTAKLVLVLLADMANDDAECWPSLGRICRDAGITHNTARSALSSLEADGLIRRSERPGDSTVYTVRVGEPLPKSEPPPDVEPLPDFGIPAPTKICAPPLPKSEPHPYQNLNPNHHRTTIEPSVQPIPPYNPPNGPVARQSPSKPVKAPKEPSRATEVPEDWWPDAKGIELAQSLGIDHTAEVPRFIASHRAKGNKFIRLGQAWGTWCRSPYAKIMLPGRSTGPPRNGHVTVADALADFRNSLSPHPKTIDHEGTLL